MLDGTLVRWVDLGCVCLISAAGEVLSEPLGYSMLQLCNSSHIRSMCGNEGGYLALLLNHFCSTARKGSEDHVY